jgi:sec-independent protein translocase protein TatA
LLIFAIIVVLFGAKKLRNFGEDFGEAIKGFRKAMAEPEDLPPTTSPATSSCDASTHRRVFSANAS